MDRIDSLRRFIIEELSYTGAEELLTPDYPLIEKKVIDSLGIFQIVTFMEDEFEVEVDDEELIPEHFGTLAAMSRLMEAKMAR